ncbi:MAG: GGDEF domain-containing protein [Roseburia sp.]|nr:GGDEF domain-containing protein [Roseburia sp.]
MKNIAKTLYAICFVLVLILVCIFHFHSHVNENIFRSNHSFCLLTDYEYMTYNDETSPTGIVQEYNATLHDVPDYNGCITFYTIHQEVDVYIEEELVYQIRLADGDHLSQTPGYEWAEVYLNTSDEGKELRIFVYPVYESSLSNQLKIYYGDNNAIRSHLMRENLPVILIASLAVILGIVFFVFYLTNIKNEELDRSILMLGIFSIAAGLWKLCDMTAAPLIFENSLTLSTIAILSITMMVVPFLAFIQKQLQREQNNAWWILSLLCSLAACIIILLQLCGIADLRETLFVSHIIIAISSIFVIINSIREAKRNRFTRKMQLTIICCFMCIIGVLIDMAVYYHSGSSGSMIYCLLAFLIYAAIMGLMSARETRRLIDRAHKADHYHNLALHDTLTGLYNRAFYYEFLKKENVYRENCFIIMMDVNDLKLCNDTMGHDWGDELLVNSSKLIKKAFPIGECLRMGGDEFCVLLPESSEAECKLCLNNFDELLEQFNEQNPNTFPVSIAYGYANYLKNIDLDFSDTMRRADKMMYQMKLDMKSYVR